MREIESGEERERKKRGSEHEGGREGERWIEIKRERVDTQTDRERGLHAEVPRTGKASRES